MDTNVKIMLVLIGLLISTSIPAQSSSLLIRNAETITELKPGISITCMMNDGNKIKGIFLHHSDDSIQVGADKICKSQVMWVKRWQKGWSVLSYTNIVIGIGVATFGCALLFKAPEESYDQLAGAVLLGQGIGILSNGLLIANLKRKWIIESSPK